MNYTAHKGLFYFKTINIAVVLLLTAAPVAYLSVCSIAAAVKGTVTIDIASGSGLFIKSLLINLGAAGLSLLLGFLSAMCVWTFFEKYAFRIAAGIMLFVLVPPFIHVQSWIYFVDKLNALSGQYFGTVSNFTGVSAVVLTVAFSYLPVTAGLCTTALNGIPAELSDLCMLDGGGKAVFIKAYLPLLYPVFYISGGLVFMLNINDYGIPSVFGVNVFALELFSRFSADGKIHPVFFASVPLLALCAVLLVLFSIYLSRSGFSFNTIQGKNPFKKEKFVKIPAAVGFLVLALFLIVPLYNLIFEAVRPGGVAAAALLASTGELSYSVAVSALAAVFGLIPAFIVACLFYKSKVKMYLLPLAALPFVFPSPITALSLIEMWNTPLLKHIYQSPVMPAIAMTARYGFVEIAVMTIAVSRLDRAYIENMVLHFPGIFPYVKCLITLVGRECLSCALIVFALSMGEFGVALLVTPPGYQLLTIKIYNYLHYGASETVAVLCLFMLVVMLAIALFIFLLVTGKRNE